MEKRNLSPKKTPNHKKSKKQDMSQTGTEIAARSRTVGPLVTHLNMVAYLASNTLAVGKQPTRNDERFSNSSVNQLAEIHG